MSDLSTTPPTPKGFQAFTANVGIRDTTKDFLCIKSEVPCVATGVFTQSLFAGPSVTLSRQHLKNGQAQAVVVISKNANVANGAVGFADAQEVIALAGSEIGVEPEDIVIASTGVIGRPYPMDTIRTGIVGLGPKLAPANFQEAAQAIMTTDTFSKYAMRQIDGVTLVGIAKGVGMIEPNMATMLAFLFTDAAIPQEQLRPLFKSVMDKTFNCLSIDTDTSTSDTAVLLANGLAGWVDPGAFAVALEDLSRELVLMIAKDGEGATKVIEVRVDRAESYRQAKRVAKAIVNSPLVKTAIHGADPNWGRVAMAVGKCEDEPGIDQDNVVIRFGDLTVYPDPSDPGLLGQLKQIMSAEKVKIHVSLNSGEAEATVWGCDLSDGYIEINGRYST